MSRKSIIVTLCILGAVGVLGTCCCTSGLFDENPNPHGNPGGPGGHGGVHVAHRPGWLFWGGSSYYGGSGIAAPHGAGTGAGAGASSPRGGFGSIGHASGSGSAGAGA